jgi:chaperone BCS1
MVRMVFTKTSSINPDFICKFNPILEGNIFNNIIKDYKKFVNSYKKYMALGVPYKRGYLFYGPPGTGKTTMAMNIAKRVGRFCVFTSSVLKSNKIRHLFKTTPKNSVIIFDDFDTYVKRWNRKHDTKENSENMALGDILGAIDDIPADSGIILIATTNKIEEIDKALCRVGRFDFKVKFDYATKTQIKNFFLRYYKKMFQEAEIFSNILTQKENIVMANIQELLLISNSEKHAIQLANNFIP